MQNINESMASHLLQEHFGPCAGAILEVCRNGVTFNSAREGSTHLIPRSSASPLAKMEHLHLPDSAYLV